MGYRDEYSRGKQLQEFIAEKHIFLLNSNVSPPTFEHNNRQGDPDLTMVTTNHSLAAICEWDVLEEEIYSDHKFVKICINSDISSFSFARFKTAHGGHCKFVNLFRSKVQDLQNLISNSSNKEEFNETTRTIQLEIHKTCKQVYKIKRTPLIPNVIWWNRYLQIKKQELKALARRLQKSKGEGRIHYKIVLSEKRALFGKAVKRTQRGSWRHLCTQTQTPCGTPYRSASKAYKLPSDWCIQDNPNPYSPSDHRSSTPPPTNTTKSNLCPSCSSKIFIQLFHPDIQTNRLRKQKQWNSLFTRIIFFSTIKSHLQKFTDSGAKAIYTDGSKTDEGTGSAYCILENYGIIASWTRALPFIPSIFDHMTTARAEKKEVQCTIPDSTYVCSKFDFYLILPCHGKFEASSLKRNCGKLTMQNRLPRLQNECATSSPLQLAPPLLAMQACCEFAKQA
ncbi:hypothetical protein AVEN_129099-1 [Araneus ventricosus]|uniref:Endonuclease/exonuclease/phosphatase domain-containing protein n=1 Tax=Araneus ventricosus TaxID=182803 RepID=A0A4Y2V5I9_ARAVE|nr:hypothetical protein AVEN_129099-1 [Araneus ventricosus]